MIKPYTETQQKRIANNIVQACKDIEKLSPAGYNYIYLASGFIAHYNRFGFMDYYSRESLKADILANARFNQWKNFTPNDADYDYYMSKASIYNLIFEGLKNV